jgi:hypothetical protein
MLLLRGENFLRGTGHVGFLKIDNITLISDCSLAFVRKGPKEL